MVILNLRDKSELSKYQYIRVDRSSPLGNPFDLRGEDERLDVIEGYRRYLWYLIRDGKRPVIAAHEVANELMLQPSPLWEQKKWTCYQVLSALRSIDSDANLACWCYPKACHAEVIIKASAYLRSI